MHDATKRTVTARLRRIEGQVRGVLRMVEDDILRDHVSHCVAGAFASGDPVEQRHKVEELVETIGRMTR